MNNTNWVVEKVFRLYEEYGAADYIGEPVSQLEHMVLASFFHDIGHLCVEHTLENDMDGFGIRSHEKIGADFLRFLGFPERIAKLVENHVQAKRYLTFKYPDYYHALSEASKITLEFQGGRMTAAEAARFESDPLFEISLLMRKWDDLAKQQDVPLPDLEVFKEKARRVLDHATTGVNSTMQEEL
jgi:putative nucleotidyltransferase with HDIG domain